MQGSTKKTLYEILGVAQRAPPEEITSAYEAKQAANKASRAPDAALQMALKEAHQVLSNPQRRAVYDNSLKSRVLAQARQTARAEESSGLGKMPIVALALVVLIGAGWWLVKRNNKSVAPEVVRVERLNVPQPDVGRPQAATVVDAGPELSPEQLYAKVSQNVVRINVLRRDGSAAGHGSGIVLDADTVLTNCHVALGGDVVQVRDQQDSLPASITVADEELDLCKLRVSGLTKRPATVSAAQLNVGQKVFAIGSPHGLDLTLSDGLVSSLREGPSGTYIQTTAPVSPGSSGGGLFDQRGRLVGIITFQVRDGQNLNFALPVEWLEKMVDRRRGGQRFASNEAQSADAKPWLGTWHCYGPLTGRGVKLVFEANNTYGGTYDGKPIGGYYNLNVAAKTLFLGGQGENTSFTLEELSAQRIVMSRGEGRRLACNR